MGFGQSCSAFDQVSKATGEGSTAFEREAVGVEKSGVEGSKRRSKFTP
jgi:hypothetical protein